VGLTNGEIHYDSESVDTDDGESYEFEVISKNFQLPTNVQTVNKLELEFVVSSATDIEIHYSKDLGLTWNLLKEVSLSASVNKQLVTVKKNIRCRNFQFAILSSSGLFELTNYAFYVDTSGELKSNSSSSL
jgi:hypothetical protein